MWQSFLLGTLLLKGRYKCVWCLRACIYAYKYMVMDRNECVCTRVRVCNACALMGMDVDVGGERVWV